MWGLGLGRTRSTFGVWCDRQGLSQQDLKQLTGLSHATVSNLCSDPSYQGTELTRRRLIEGLRREGYNVYEDDFWA